LETGAILNFTDPVSLAMPVGIISAVLAILIGILFAFFGYRLFKIPMGIAGFTFGLSVGTMIASQLTDIIWVMLVAGVVAGVGFCLLAIFVKKISVFILGAHLGAITALFFFFTMSEFGVSFPPWILIGILAAAGGVSAVIFKTPMFIVSTSFMGSWALVFGIFSFIPSSPEGFIPWLRVIAWVVVGIGGLLVQYKITAKKKIGKEKKPTKGGVA
jgi:hypothetical protein